MPKFEVVVRRTRTVQERASIVLVAKDEDDARASVWADKHLDTAEWDVFEGSDEDYKIEGVFGEDQM